MSSPSQPAHLSNHQRNTLRQIFQHPAGHNIEWRAVLPLLEAVGRAEEQHGGKVAVIIWAPDRILRPVPRGMQPDCVRNGRIGRLALRMPEPTAGRPDP